MLKKIISLFLSIMLVCSVALAEEQEASATNTSVTYTLTLDDAVNIALTDNPQLEACEIKKKNYITQLDAAKINKSNYSSVREISVSSGFDLIYVKGGYYIDTYKNAAALSDYEYEQIKATVSYNVTQKYFNYKNCEKLLEIANNSFKLVEENYNSAKLSYDLGLISKLDLDNAEISMKKAAYMVDTYKNNLELAKDDLKIALRKNNENCEFILTDTIVCTDYSGNITEDLKTAEASRYDILALKNNYVLAEKYLDLTALPKNSARYTSAYSSFITAEYNYTNNKDLILLGVKSSYNNISSTRNDLDIAESNLALKKTSHNISKIKFDQGMITNSELSTSLNEVAQAEIELENAKLAYKLAVEKYKYEISIGL